MPRCSTTRSMRLRKEAAPSWRNASPTLANTRNFPDNVLGEADGKTCFICDKAPLSSARGLASAHTARRIRCHIASKESQDRLAIPIYIYSFVSTQKTDKRQFCDSVYRPKAETPPDNRGHLHPLARGAVQCATQEHSCRCRARKASPTQGKRHGLSIFSPCFLGAVGVFPYICICLSQASIH